MKDDFFFSCYRYSDGRVVHDAIENMVLEIYTEIVCGLEKDRKRVYAIQEVEDIQDTSEHKSTHLFIQVETQGGDKKSGDKAKKTGSHTKKAHDRTYARRKLPENWVASEEALERARELGIELPEGYTYVKPYKVGGVKGIREKI
ncbi:hypothetical protein D3C72_743830 [compost metagenome]